MTPGQWNEYQRQADVIEQHQKWKQEIEELKLKHEKIRDILIKYGNEEHGDCIIDEICEVVGIPPTTIYYKE